jgi:hypothetical protein
MTVRTSAVAGAGAGTSKDKVGLHACKRLACKWHEVWRMACIGKRGRGQGDKGGICQGEQLGTPLPTHTQGLWTRCDKCGVILYMRHLRENAHICFGCGHHLRMSAQERIDSMIDAGADACVRTCAHVCVRRTGVRVYERAVTSPPPRRCPPPPTHPPTPRTHHHRQALGARSTRRSPRVTRCSSTT